MNSLDSLGARLRALAPAVDHCALRVVEEVSEVSAVRQDVPEPGQTSLDRGGMITVVDGDGLGYAATSDLSDEGLRTAIGSATQLARLARGRSVFRGERPALAPARGTYRSPTRQPLALSKAERIELLMRESRACRRDARIVDWAASLWTIRSRQLTVTADGGELEQSFDFTIPSLHVVAHHAGLTQVRSWGGRYNGFCQQGGLEVLERAGFAGSGERTAEEALQLITAPNCPSGTMDVILMPDQMMLQIHESIGHPLELDRILGDERNYAGTSFVTLDMFGHYQYGSELLNVTYDPGREAEFASFAFDDEGSPAQREYLIRAGRLERPLGGATSQQRARAHRAGIEGVATTRACSWNRPPIDRMSNLNLEAGTSSLDEMIASIDDGVLMRTNVSWSIDDSRNKFQFGCEMGQRIRGGQLAEVVRNPNYRGVSATFWRSLAMVGGPETTEVMGTPYCGKGEPNQVIRVGHASPPCKFTNIDVFGAAR
ncbi:MAG TPA: TldD/PmbA family protein [Burkholderiaceae bacterium]|nr:TldD/PmbA family protein [Burkholderiaceae bacterium]HPE00759.1 TldD/PmbA family protein [Burkholderiaceae bacterium]HRZ01933.1 TldD/PmbA family protein [Burkholderiaceae bacterium]